MPVRILAFSGSSRKDSFNQRIVAVAADAARAAGASVELVDLADYPMPLFNQDEEAATGKSEACKVLREKMIAADGMLLACPEYNGSVTPLLKNTLDWVSRPEPGEDPAAGLPAYKGKVVTLMSASPGGLGGLRGLAHMRDILSGVGCIVLPAQVAVGAVYTQFDEQGEMKPDGMRTRIEALGRGLVEFLDRLGPAS